MPVFGSAGCVNIWNRIFDPQAATTGSAGQVITEALILKVWVSGSGR
jgi:hypothetical protein